MKDLRIGSLCTGTGALDMAAMDVLGGSMAWHCQYEPPDKEGRPDRHQYAARILAHHWPDVPNHGDVAFVDWSTVEQVDIVTAGFPCTDISLAGLGAGIKEGTRSGLWFTIARAIGALRPRFVVLENVRAIVGRRPGLDVVLSELARLGFNAVWVCVRASDVGAPHQRDRWFLLAWSTDTAGPRLEGAGLRGRFARGAGVAADAHGVGHERDWATGQSAQRHSEGPGRVVADPAGIGAGEPADQTVSVSGGGHAWPVPGRRDVLAAPDAESDGRHQGRPEPAGIVGGSDAALGGSAVPADASGLCNQDEQGGGHGSIAVVAEPGPGDRAGLGGSVEGTGEPGGSAAVVAWGTYGPAVHRWERILGRPAPRPTDDRGRLAPAFVEWMMGLPAGWVADVPAPSGMTDSGLRNARLKALGNGVVRQQAAYALRILLDRMASEVAA